MTREEMQALCLSLPGASAEVKWEDTLCFVVHKKLFALTGTWPESVGISLKAPKALYAGLTSEAGIDPAPYLARYCWVRLDNYPSMAHDKVAALIRTSYDEVVAKLPKRVQRELEALE